MYSIVTREDTIRIPAEYIRAGRNLVDHIDELANDAFERHEARPSIQM